MRAYFLFNKIQNSSLISFIISSIFLAVAALLQLLGLAVGERADVILNDFSTILLRLIPYVFCAFITSYFTTDRRLIKTFWAVFCLIMLSTAFNGNISFIAGIITAAACSFFFESFNKPVSFSITFISAVILGILLNTVSDFFSNIQMSVAYSISGKGILSSILFAVISTFLSLFGNNSFMDLFFYKSYGGTIISNDEVITGIKDLAANNYDGELISTYMTGHFFILFALVGITLCLGDELKKGQRLCLIITAVCAVLSGNFSLLLLFIFFESWYLFFSVILISALSYAAAVLLDIRISYALDGGIIEMLLNIDKPVYLAVCGLVFIAIGYFTAKFSVLKNGISDFLNIYIPDRLNKLVSALGGIVNIIKIKENTVEVRNPKLVNNFDIDCEIRENVVKVNDNMISELKDYL